MKTTLAELNKDAGTNDLSIEQLAKGGVLPLLVGDDEVTTEVTFCTSISGGADEVQGMPRKLTLQKFAYNQQMELHKFDSEYVKVSHVPPAETPGLEHIAYGDMHINLNSALFDSDEDYQSFLKIESSNQKIRILKDRLMSRGAEDIIRNFLHIELSRE